MRRPTMHRHWLQRLFCVLCLATVAGSISGSLKKGIGAEQPPAGQAEQVDQLLDRASQAAARGDSAKAVELATEAIEKDPQAAPAYRLRGREQFRLGKIGESVADFDQYVKFRPQNEPRQWERGISYYYAKQYKKGAAQFELYQTFHDNDVENSVWRYLCMAADVGVEKARGAMLPIKNDRRVPMMQIYDLFRGRLQPGDVLAAAKAGEPPAEVLNSRLFYAHLYIGLHYEAAGKDELARGHILAAERDHRIGHYMWDVAHVHAELLRRKDR